jgi:transposase-like protein
MEHNELPKTLQEAVRFFSDDLFCVQFVASRRWPDGKVICPRCDESNNTFMESRKVWQCKNKECKKQFSVKVGTIFEDSPIGLDKWLTAMWLIVNAKNGISSYEIHRSIGVTQKTAWFMLHRLRLAMQSGSFSKLSGTVEADETWVGGDAKNMHHKRRQEFKMKGGRRDHRTCVLGMVERKGRVRAKIVDRARKHELVPVLEECVQAGTTLYTDSHTAYDELYKRYVHDTVNHSIEYVRGHVHTNSIENYWSLLKRTIKGTYVSVAPEHLQRYIEEQSFRYNERKGTDKTRFLKMIESVSGKRVTYAQLIGYQSTGH